MKGNKNMYDIPEPRYYLEPKEGEIVGYCTECGQDIYAGEDIWEIKGEWYCECCVDSFRTEAERDDYFENAI